MDIPRIDIVLGLFLCLINFCSSGNTSDATQMSENQSGENCWLVGNFIVIKSCKPCKEFEKKLNPECEKTGYKQLIRCEKGKKQFYVSCSGVESTEERKFWIFEACMVSLAFLSNISIWIRRRKLDYYAYSKLQKQMSDVGA